MIHLSIFILSNIFCNSISISSKRYKISLYSTTLSPIFLFLNTLINSLFDFNSDNFYLYNVRKIIFFCNSTCYYTFTSTRRTVIQMCHLMRGNGLYTSSFQHYLQKDQNYLRLFLYHFLRGRPRICGTKD